MANRNTVWVCAVDAGRGRLLRCEVVPPGRCHVDEQETIDWNWEAHQHGRPSPRAGKNSNSYASEGHEVEEDLKRFARQAAAWLEQKLDQHQMKELVLFAPPRFLGALRRVCPARLDGCLREHEADLTNHSAGTLSRHPAIQELVCPRVASSDSLSTQRWHHGVR